MSAKADFMQTWMRQEQAKAETARRAPAGTKAAPPDGSATEAAPRQAEPRAEPAGAIIGVPQLGAFADMDYFYLLAPLGWRPAQGPFRPVTVERGFVTDLASVPGLFWSLAAPQGRHGVAAIIHDWLYWKQDCTREEADLIFDGIMRDLGVPTWKRLTFYYAVRWRAGRYWDEYSRDREQGRLQPRILKRFPEHAGISWRQWQAEPDVFS